MTDTNLRISTSAAETLAVKGLKIINKIGEGSYAEVYLVEYQNKTAKGRNNLACKVIDAAKAPQDFVKKFLPREIEILLKLDHPHIIRVHSIFQRKMKCYMLMRFAENGDLLRYILKRGRLTEGRARVWFGQIALALDYLHRMDVAHRDLKCENVLITANQNAKLSDFGFARFCVDSEKKPVLSGTYCGSLSYASPEILRGKPYAPRSADVWSLGVLLYVMLNKSLPFNDTHARRLYNLQVKKKWKFRPRVVDCLSRQCKELVRELLQPDATRRLTMDRVLGCEWLRTDSYSKTWSAAEGVGPERVIKEIRISSGIDNSKLDRSECAPMTLSDTDEADRDDSEGTVTEASSRHSARFRSSSVRVLYHSRCDRE